MRALLLVATSLLAALTLTACSAEQVGLVGVGVDAEGSPVAVMTSCEGPAVAISLSSVSTKAAPQETGRDELALDNPSPSMEDPAAVPLADPPPPWSDTTGDMPDELDPERRYEVRAWPDEPSMTLGAVTFTAADLERLAVGDVYFTDEGGDRIASAAEFVETGLERC
jgi:hypothetical protein